jgi:(p)ppGpp synthase/HD superfamily hydrolase
VGPETPAPDPRRPSLARALELSEAVHAGQTRADGSATIGHPLAVAALVLRFGGNEAQAMAALVHDTIGDARGSREALTDLLGAEVARLAHGFADPPTTDLPRGVDAWQHARKAYLEHLRGLDERTLLVVACEELHEVQDLLLDLRYRSALAWKRYAVHSMVVFWYFREVLGVMNARLKAPEHRACVSELATAVRSLQGHCLE